MIKWMLITSLVCFVCLTPGTVLTVGYGNSFGNLLSFWGGMIYKWYLDKYENNYRW